MSRVDRDTQLSDSVKIGSHVLIYPNVTILGPCVLGDHVTIAPGVIIGADGSTIEDSGDLQKTLRGRKVGDVLKLTISRDGQQQLVTVKLQEMPKET